MPRAFLVKNRKEDGTEDPEEEMMTETPDGLEVHLPLSNRNIRPNWKVCSV